MKALKYIFILLLVAIIAGAVYFSLQDGKYEVKRSALVEAPPSLVFNQISDFENWDNWNTLIQGSEVNVQLNEQTTGVDTQFSFTDEDGTGTVTITSLEPNNSISMETVYEHGLSTSRATTVYNLVQTEKGTEVSITRTGEKGLLEKAYATLIGENIDQVVGSIYEESLKNLNKYLIAEMKKYTINVDGLIDYSGGYYLYMSSSANLNNISKLQTQMLRSIHSFMNDNKIDSYGADMLIYEKFDEQASSAIFSAAVPVRDRIITAEDSRILVGLMEPQSAIKITLKGAYENLAEAWAKGAEYIRANGLQTSDKPPFEVYKTDPSQIDNPANYITEIYLPVL